MSRRKGYRAARAGWEGQRNALGSELLRSVGEGTDLTHVQAEFQAHIEGRLGSDPETWAKLAERCRKCGEIGHWARECRNFPCYRCREWGHRASEMPEGSAVNRRGHGTTWASGSAAQLERGFVRRASTRPVKGQRS